MVNEVFVDDKKIKDILIYISGMKHAEQNLLQFDIIKKSFEPPSQDEVFVTIKNY